MNGATVAEPRTGRKSWWPRFLSTLGSLWKSRISRAGLIIIFAIITLVIIGPSVVTYSPYAFSTSIDRPPSLAHPFGTDWLGHDLFSQVVWGARISLVVAVVAALLSTLIGTFAGVFAGYYGKLESPLSGATDIIMALPAFPFLILLGMLLTPTNLLITLIVVLVLWAPVSRTIWPQVGSIKKRTYVDAAKTSGFGDLGVTLRVIMPEIAPISMAYFVINTATAIVIVTGLEFIGVGNVDVVTWGSILYWAQQYAFTSGAWWWILAPGLIISLFAMGLALIGYAVEELFNPRLRTRI